MCFGGGFAPLFAHAEAFSFEKERGISFPSPRDRSKNNSIIDEKGAREQQKKHTKKKKNKRRTLFETKGGGARLHIFIRRRSTGVTHK